MVWWEGKLVRKKWFTMETLLLLLLGIDIDRTNGYAKFDPCFGELGMMLSKAIFSGIGASREGPGIEG
jgi:hypothetical protein